MSRIFVGAVGASFLTACSTYYVDSRVEKVIRDSLPRVLGHAASYDVRVAGSIVDASYFDNVYVARQPRRAGKRPGHRSH